MKLNRTQSRKLFILKFFLFRNETLKYRNIQQQTMSQILEMLTDMNDSGKNNTHTQNNLIAFILK